MIVFESCHFPNSKNGTKLAVVIDELKSVARAHGLPVFEYAPRTARKIVVHDGNATKRKVAETVSQRYPQLYVHLEQSKCWQDTYWGHMFDATEVVLALRIAEAFRDEDNLGRYEELVETYPNSLVE